MSCLIMLVLLLFLLVVASSDINQGQFSFNGYLNVEGVAGVDSSGLFTLTNTTSRIIGQIFYKNPIQFKNSTNATVSPFPTTFIFAIVPGYTDLGGHGLAFVISPNDEISGALPTHYLGLFKETNIGLDSNHVVAIELGTARTIAVGDIDGNHVSIDINSPRSVTAASAGYLTDESEFKISTSRVEIQCRFGLNTTGSRSNSMLHCTQSM